MADQATATAAMPLDGGPSSGASAAAEESDFSLRKLRIAAVCLIGMTFGSVVLPICAIPMLMLPMTSEFGWSRAEYALAMTFLAWCSALSMPIFGRIADRVGERLMIMVGTVSISMLCFMLSLQTGSIVLFYACFALLGALGGTAVLYTKVIAALFTKHRGKALAIAGAESTLALAIIPVIANILLLNFGWRGVFVGFGLIPLSILPFIHFTLRVPGEAGFMARWRQTRNSGGEPSPKPAAGPVFEGVTSGEAFRDRTFWVLLLATLICVVVPKSLMTTHMVALIVDKGFTQTVAVTMLSTLTMMGLVGSLAGGFLADRIQTPKIAVLFKLVAALGVLLLALVTTTTGGLPLLLVTVTLIGFALAAHNPLAVYFTTRFFGLRAFNELYAVQHAAQAAVLGIAVPLIGVVYDETGSYGPAFALSIAGSLIGAVLVLMLGRYRYAANVGQVAA